MDSKDMPLWVALGVSSFRSRKTLVYITIACLIFGLAFLPLPFVSDNWNWMEVLGWSGPMYPLALWYWCCIRWVDKHSSWEVS